MEHRLQISLKTYALSAEDLMATGTLGCAMTYGSDSPFKYCSVNLLSTLSLLTDRRYYSHIKAKVQAMGSQIIDL